MWGLSAVTSINEELISCSMRSVFALMPTTHDLVKHLEASPISRADDSRFEIITGLKTLSSNTHAVHIAGMNFENQDSIFRKVKDALNDFRKAGLIFWKIRADFS